MKNKNIINLIILIVFIVITFVTGAFHEPWADEAQSWLIARDASITDILCTLERYEGTPPLWHFLLKLLIFCGLEYKYFFVVSVFFACLGVGIILYKLDLPLPIKILLPFTFYILYEYAIVSRSYCMILPVLALIAYVYKDRKEKVILYNVLLGVLALVSLHMSVLSGILYLFEIAEIFKDLTVTDNFKKHIKSIVVCLFLGLLYIAIIIIVVPTGDVKVPVAVLKLVDEEEFGLKFVLSYTLYILINLSEVFAYNPKNGSEILTIISFVLMILAIVLPAYKNKKKGIFLSLVFSEMIFFGTIRLAIQHMGIVILTYLFALYIVKDTIYVKLKMPILYVLCIIFAVQIYWSYLTISLEITENFSAGKATAEYIKTLDYENMKIYSSGYYSTSILPYFDKDIFYNDRGGHTYYVWSDRNNDWLLSGEDEFLYERDESEEFPDAIVLCDNKKTGGYAALIEKIRTTGEYKEKHFEGRILFKGFRDGNLEGFYVFERVK